MNPRVMSSDYMHFAKLKAGARYNLASSGVLDCTLDDLDPDLSKLALHGPNSYGYAPLVERIAERFGIGSECVVTPGGGCSFANHLAFAALLAPGDRVLVEAPTYELITSTLGYLQADVHRFARRPEAAWALEPGAVAAEITPDTRLVVLTNLHNPSSAPDGAEAIAAVARAADAVGAILLVDEVYLELTFENERTRTAFTPHGNVVVTSSLTKAYGLSGLRCGWILAPPKLAERMRRLNDLFGAHAPHVAERLAVTALDRLPHFRARADAILNANRAAYRALLGDHPALDQHVFDQGTTVFPRLRRGDGDALFSRLTQEFETSLVPGRFFGMADHVRIGLAGEQTATREGLSRLAQALSTSD